MYEENVKRELDILPVVIRVSIILVVMFLVYMVVSSTIRNYAPLSDAELLQQENISIMEQSAIKYFNDEDIVITDNNAIYLTLEEMIDQNIVLDFSYDTNLCDLNNSYVKITRVSNNEYNLKAQLICDENENSIITTFKKQL